MQYEKEIQNKKKYAEKDNYNKKTLVFYINSIHDGGAERVMVNLTTCFAENGYKVVLLTSFIDTWEYEVSPFVKRVSIEKQECKCNVLKKNVKRIYGLRKVCKSEKVDVLISFMAEPNIRAIIASLGLNIKTIISVRSKPSLEYAGRLRGIIKKYLLPLADGCVFQTEEAKKCFPMKLQRKSIVIANAVNTVFYEQNYEPKRHCVVACGRLENEKNYPLLIDAFNIVKKKISDAKLEIYGTGSLAGILKSKINELKLQDSLILKGVSHDIPKVLAHADLFVICSDYEGMPNALMEAMAVGVPAISTDCPCGGPRELFGEELSDMLIPVGDVKILANKMIELLSNDERRAEVGRKMKERSEAFRIDKIGKEWIEYAEKVCMRKKLMMNE